jgi:hypothetical protein
MDSEPERNLLEELRTKCNEVRQADSQIRSIIVCIDRQGRQNDENTTQGLWVYDTTRADSPPIDVVFGALEVVQNVMADVFDRAIEANLTLRQETYELMQKHMEIRTAERKDQDGQTSQDQG